MTLAQRNGSTNGHKPELAKRTTHVQEEATGAELLEHPPWLKALRESMAASINGGDLKDIMAAQVAKAKEGDRKAADFVFRQAHQMLKSAEKRVTITQNNFYGEERPDTPALAEPGSASKVDKMRARAAAGLPVATSEDAGYGRPVSDEEEKALRRKQEEDGDDL